MNNYTLEIRVDSEDLQRLLNKNQSIVVVKKIGPTPVVWKSMNPYTVGSGGESVTTWSGDYGLYVSSAPIPPGTIITMMSSISLRPQYGYRFDGISFSEISGDSMGQNIYKAENACRDSLTFGLTQDGSVVSAEVVPTNHTVLFTPAETIQVFAQAYARVGQVLSSVPSDALTLDFTITQELRIKFDAGRGKFVKQ